MEAQAASLQSAANEAMATLMRHLKCGDPAIELRAARTIFQIYQKSVENAELKNTIDELQQANDRQAEDIRTLEKENLVLRSWEGNTLDSVDNLRNDKSFDFTSSAVHSSHLEDNLIPALSGQSAQSVPTGGLTPPA